MANKLFYFGVGGSMPEFKQFLNNNYSSKLQIKSTYLINNKKGNKREIIEIIKKLEEN